MPDDQTPTDANRDGEAHDEVDRSVRREATERAATPDPLEVGDDRLPPGHPAQADDSFSVGEAINDDDLPADTGRPGRSADTT